MNNVRPAIPLQRALESSAARGVRLAATGVGFVFAVLAAASVLQGVLNLRSAAAHADADRAVVEAGNLVAGAIAANSAKLDRIGQLVAAEALATPEQRRATGRRLSSAFGDGAAIELYAPDVRELEAADFDRFGFTRAAVLSEARDLEGFALAQLRRGKNDWRVVQARPLKQGQQLVAILYADVPLATVTHPIDAVAQRHSAQLELRQQRGGGDAFVVASFGSRKPGSVPGASVPIRNSQLAMGALYPTSFQVADVLPMLAGRSTFALSMIALLMALLSAAAFWFRRHAIKRAGGDLDDDSLEVMPTDVHSVMPRPKPSDRDPLQAMSAKAAAADVAVVAAQSYGAAPPEAPAATSPVSSPTRRIATDVERSIFRAYDIRGVMGKTLSPEVARAIGAAIGSEARERGLREIVVGRDGRLSGPVLLEGLIDGLRGTGCDVIDIGLVPTPVLYFATYHLNVGSGVMLTGSHNPPDHNGFKIVLGGETLSGEAIQALYARIAESRIVAGSGGLQELDVRRDYIDRIAGDIQLERKLRVVVDAGNGAAGEVGPAVLEAIGCDVVSLNCEIDGNFPSHHPDPSDPANLQDLLVSVKQFNADIGIAYDGDGDRLGVVTQQGEIINPDRLLMLFARDVLGRAPGASIIYDVKCTGKLHEVILGHGGSPIMWKTGHSLIKAKMREEDAELAGEMSGHFFFRERWYGFDDGIYAGARLAEILASSDRPATEVFRELPNAISTPELKLPMDEGRTHAFVEQFARRATFPGARLTTLDGIRADWPDGWGLVRSSNTTAVLVMRFEASNADALTRIQEDFRKQLLAVDAKLTLPF